MTLSAVADLPPGLRVGHPLIDRQHAILVLLIGRVTGGPDPVPLQPLQDLAKYAIEHFRCEDELMRESGFTESAAHHAGHAEFTARAGAMVQAALRGRAGRAEASAWLCGWLADHIGGDDVLLARHLQCAASAVG